jgi:hypothetical protein
MFWIKKTLYNGVNNAINNGVNKAVNNTVNKGVNNAVNKDDLTNKKRLPSNVIKLISEYAKPVTRPDWRKGSPLSNIFKYSPIMVKTHKFLSTRMPNACKKHDNLADLIVNLGSERVFQMYEYMFDYTNFYFYLICEDNSFLIKKPVLKKTGNFKIKRHLYQNSNRIEHIIVTFEFYKN